MRKITFIKTVATWVAVWLACTIPAPVARAAVYYFSSSAGDDDNNGTTPGTAFATIARFNSLDLSPGDEVRFQCGDEWSEEPLIVRDSGTVSSPVLLTSNPPGCVNQPVLSGSRPVCCWNSFSSNIFWTDLDAGENSGRFPNGINQVFRGNQRLPIGRWPNLDAGEDEGYAVIDSQPQPSVLVDNSLPNADWTGAALHFKSERWYLYNREVVASGPHTLTANDNLVCRDGCTGWGYYLDSHLATLDREEEWYFDASSNRLYLFSTSGPPSADEIRASFLPGGEVADQAGIILGGNFPEHVQHVIVDNLEVRQWAGNGIMMARLLRDDQNKYITIRNNTIEDVGRIGISLRTFVYQASQAGNGPNGIRGGLGCVVANNAIIGANLYGIETASVDSSFEDNHIVDIALIGNLTRDGMGCDFTGTVCGLNGAGIRIKLGADDQTGYSGTGNTIRYNRIEQVGMNGIDVFGPENLIARNRIANACQTLGDCGGIRTFGGDNFTTTGVFDNIIRENIVLDTLGNTDGVAPPLEDLWGFGIYIDNFSDGIDVVDNTVVGSTASGIVFGNSRGQVAGNHLFDNSTGTSFIAHMRFNYNPTVVSVEQNEIYALEADRPVVALKRLATISQADFNRYFNPRDDRLVRVQDTSEFPMTLTEWQAFSGEDANSSEAWFVLDPSDPSLGTIFVNDSTSPLQVNLGSLEYFDLDHQPVSGSFTLAPYRSRILILRQQTSMIFQDGFESGDIDAWSSNQP